MATKRERRDAVHANPAVYTRTGEDGREHRVVAYSPADHVRLTYDGWHRDDSKAAAKIATAANIPPAGSDK